MTDKDKYKEVFEKELDNLYDEYAMKKYLILKRQEDILITMKKNSNTTFIDDEYIKNIQDSLNNLKNYFKNKKQAI